MSSPESMAAPTHPGSSGAANLGNATNAALKLSQSNGVSPSSPSFTQAKTDKPRPHVCSTCLRSFARLEHLKRHERSHTKEKPFECPECTRCFARRDLLLRHQQKLHSSTTPSSRPRSGRRESAAGVATGRVRKNSVANSGSSGMRPRANTLSHIEAGSLGLTSNANPALARNYAAGHNHNNSFSGLSNAAAYHYRGVSTGHHAVPASLPKIETGLPIDLSGGLRTAPPFGGFGAEFAMNSLAYGTANASTINPHALHFHGMQGLGIDASGSPYAHFFNAAQGPHLENDEENNFDWMTQGFENQMTFNQATENAVEDSSPSAMSSNSPAGVSELMLDGSMSTMHNMPLSSTLGWQSSMAHQTQIVNSPANLDFSSGAYNEGLSTQAGTISPKSLLAQSGIGLDMNFATPPDMSATDPSAMGPDLGGPPFHLPFSRHSAASTASTSSLDSSLHQSSITTSSSSELVSDQMRSLLIAGLTQSAGFGQRKYSQPSVSSPLSPDAGTRKQCFNVSNFPSTQDLQRYVSAYRQYFHPHLPFLHLPTLNFESPDYIASPRAAATQSQYGHIPLAGGGSCLILSIAAVGALYEHETVISRELFEFAKRLISSVLEERRKSNLTRTHFGSASHAEVCDTPLWLVQAMLLNVIYGHNCGDKTAADIASNHCVALVSLARGAELARPPPSPSYSYGNGLGSSMQNPGTQMQGISNGWNSMLVEPDDSDWRTWKIVEERKRTLYSVFILSSMLVSAYNHAPVLTNSEIRLDLPCDEELWAADSPQAWRAMGGAAAAESKSTTFSAALGHLLTAAQRQQQKRHSVFRPPGPENGGGDDGGSDLRPSTFGCLVLINALHNYIWETRQRHLGRQWTTQETEQMHAHIEPALGAWQDAWASNPTHSLERPNPFGVGPLSADSIPLLDLAYVRLFVNLGRSKDAFWQRDYDAMAEELATCPEAMQCTDSSQTIVNEALSHEQHASQVGAVSPGIPEYVGKPRIKTTTDEHMTSESDFDELAISAAPSTRRERHFRKAALYAADSLSMADKLGLTFADRTCRELPSQSALCAFDCAQVLAEWVTIVQERVGRYLGVLGEEDVDLLQVPGILLLEDEDRRLLDKINVVLHSAEQKMGTEATILRSNNGGYASQILSLTAHMLDRAAVWPVTKLMARSLETQAVHMSERAQNSVITRV